MASFYQGRPLHCSFVRIGKPLQGQHNAQKPFGPSRKNETWLLGRPSANSQSQKTYWGWGMGTVNSLEFLPNDDNETTTRKYQRSHLAKGEAWGNHARPGDNWCQYLGVQYLGPVKIEGMNTKPSEDWNHSSRLCRLESRLPVQSSLLM